MRMSFLFLSDEEDSIKRTKHAQNEESKAKVANGVETDDISSRYIVFIHGFR